MYPEIIEKINSAFRLASSKFAARPIEAKTQKFATEVVVNEGNPKAEMKLKTFCI